MIRPSCNQCLQAIDNTIPLLDGGQLTVITIEKLRGKPLPELALEIVQWTGLVLLLGFMAFVVTNDIRNF